MGVALEAGTWARHAPRTHGQAIQQRLAIIKLKHFPIHQPRHPLRLRAMFPPQGLHSPSRLRNALPNYPRQSPVSKLSLSACCPPAHCGCAREAERSCSPVPHLFHWTTLPNIIRLRGTFIQVDNTETHSPVIEQTRHVINWFAPPVSRTVP